MKTNPTLNGAALFFTPAPSLAKFANSKLSKDPGDWEQEIIDYLHEQHPYIAEHKIVVSMYKTDSDEGHGVGNIKIGDKVVLPIVIESNRLQPLDLFVASDRIQPLTKAAFDAAVQSQSFGKAVKPGQGEAADSSITYATLPPFDGKYAYGSSLTYTKDDLARVLSRVGDGGQLDACLANAWFTDVAGQFAKHASPVANLENQANVPATFAANFVQIRPFVKAAEAGLYEVMTPGGVATGVVFDTYLTFGSHGLVDQGRVTFIGLDKTAHAYVGRGNIGVRAVADLVSKGAVTLLSDSLDKRAALATVIDNHGVVSEPFTVLSSDNGRTRIETDDGRRFVLRTEADAFYKEAGDHVFVNDCWSIIPIGDVVEVFDDTIANQRQIPLGTASLDKVGSRIRVLNPGNVACLRDAPGEGVPLNKLGELLRDLDENSCRAVSDRLMTYGHAFIQVDQPLTKVSGRSYEFNGLTTEALANLTYAVGLFVTPELCKFAKVQEETAKRTIDTVLGLNFLGEENMHKFVDKVDTLDDAKDCIAELLLASRIGLTIDSQPLRTALFSIDAVIRDLRELRNAVNIKQV